MGGRGSFSTATNKRISYLNKQVDELNRKIEEIDVDGRNLYEVKYQSIIDELKDTYRPVWHGGQSLEEFAHSVATEYAADYYKETDRNKLARKRRKFKKELDSLKAGQFSMF